MTTATESVTCKRCGNKTHPLAVFPGGICLSCYEREMDGKPPVTAEELVAMWGGKAK